MKVVILAAGRGKRMKPLTDIVPKPLLKVGKKTLLEHTLDALPKEVTEVIIVIGYKGNKIKEFFGNSYKGKKVKYVRQGRLSGTGPATIITKKFFNPEERLMIIYGDELLKKDDFIRCFKHEFAWLCLVVKDPTKSGIVEVSPNGRILGVEEKPAKPKSHTSGAGLMLVNSDIFKYKLPKHTKGEKYVTSLMNSFVRHHEVMAVMGRKRISFSYQADIDKFIKNY